MTDCFILCCFVIEYCYVDVGYLSAWKEKTKQTNKKNNKNHSLNLSARTSIALFIQSFLW